MTTFPSLARFQTAVLPDDASLGVALDKLAFAGLWAFLFAVPWEETAPLVGGYVVGRWLGLMVIGLALFKLLATSQSRRISAVHLFMFVVVGWSALSIMWTVDRDQTLSRIGTYTQLLAAVWLIWELAPTEHRVVQLIQAYVFGTYITCALTIQNFMNGTSSADIRAASGQAAANADRYTVSGFNENDLGLMLALSIPMTIYLMVTRKNKITRWLYWIQLLGCFGAVLLTGSRGSTVAALAALAMLPLAFPRLPRTHKVTAVAICVIAIMLIPVVVPQETLLRLMSTTSDIESGTLTHRTTIWAAGLEVFRDHAFLGVGGGAYGTSVEMALDKPMIAHNTFLSVLVETGVIGFLLFLGLLGSLVFCAWRMRYLEKCLWLTVLFTWSVGVFALAWDYRKPTWIIFGLLVAHAYARRRFRGTPATLTVEAPPVNRSRVPVQVRRRQLKFVSAPVR